MFGNTAAMPTTQCLPCPNTSTRLRYHVSCVKHCRCGHPLNLLRERHLRCVRSFYGASHHWTKTRNSANPTCATCCASNPCHTCNPYGSLTVWHINHLLYITF